MGCRRRGMVCYPLASSVYISEDNIQWETHTRQFDYISKFQGFTNVILDVHEIRAENERDTF